MATAALLALPLLLPVQLRAQPAPPPKSISNSASLAFGRFAAASGGSVMVDVNGVRSRTGGVVLLASSGSPARFVISGIGNDHRIYMLGLPMNGSVKLNSGISSMQVINFVSNTPPGGLLPVDATSISVGASLQVAPGQPPGTYTGAFQVTLDYQ